MFSWYSDIFFGTKLKTIWLDSCLTRGWLVTRGWLGLAVGSCNATTLHQTGPLIWLVCCYMHINYSFRSSIPPRAEPNGLLNTWTPHLTQCKFINLPSQKAEKYMNSTLYLDSLNINDLTLPNSTLTRPLCILMIFLDLTRHLLDSNGDNSQHTWLLFFPIQTAAG